MKKLAIVILSLQGAGVACAAPQAVTHSEASKQASVAQSTVKQNIMKAESSAVESPGLDGITQTVTNTSFAFTSVHNPQKPNMTESVLLAQKIESVSVVGKEGAVAKLEVAAWVDGKSHYDTKMWTINDCADAGWRDGDFYITSKYAQGSAENLMRAFNFSSGKYVYSYTTEPASAEIHIPKDMVKRHVAYSSRRGADSACRKNEMGRKAVGVLTLTDGISQADRIAVESGNAELARSPAVALVNKKETKGAATLMVWGPAEFARASEVVRGFAVKLTYPGGSEITIPVSGDRFDLGSASTPKGVKLRRVKLEKNSAK